MSETRSLRAWKQDISPYENPLVAPTTVKTHRRKTRAAVSERSLVDPETGAVEAVSMIHTVEERDNEQFVKVFADGVKAAFGLTKTAGRVFQAVLDAYQKEAMTGGYADSVSLYWFGEGLNGESIGMSEKTFNRGLKELLEKSFLHPKVPNVYWVNPALFFKGDRVAFVREYRRAQTSRRQQLDGGG